MARAQRTGDQNKMDTHILYWNLVCHRWLLGRYVKLLFSILISTVFIAGARAQQRITKTINSNWLFQKGDTSVHVDSWSPVSLPHTWNIQDVMDDTPGYYRGDGWYKKTVYTPAAWNEKEVLLYFEAAAQVAEVFVNGKAAGKHTGSYTAFSMPISKYLKFTKEGNTPNEILVKVNNSHNAAIPPLSGDYTFFGGIYRDVHLTVLNKVHFEVDNDASNGVFITTPSVTSETADIRIRGVFDNASDKSKRLTVTHRIYDGDGKLFQEFTGNFNAGPGEKINFKQDLKNIKDIHLWSIDHPYLYRVVSTITATGTSEIVDEITNPLGFRFFKFDAAKGFFLNGQHVKLIGASRHQDYKGLGTALPDALHVRDVALVKKMGGNFIRIAHYPQDPAVLEACDRLGILASVETPCGNQITESAAFAKNALNIQREMIRQNFNHPSVIIWAYMNEVLLRPPFEKGSARQNAYFEKVAQLARRMEALTRKEDASRYTMIPNHGSFDLYHRVGLTEIPRLVGWNLYLGWYSRNFSGLGTFLDRHRKELPDKPLLITEYGADADIRLHDFEPVRFDKTVEYAVMYHQQYIKAVNDRPFVAAAMIWNLADFSSEQRPETTPHINAKGILTQDRKVKDPYLFYQANLLKEPFIKIGSKEWKTRSGFALAEDSLFCVQPVVIYSNQKRVILNLNGKQVGSAETKQGMATFEVPFINGVNRIVVASSNLDGTVLTDQAVVNFQLLSQNMQSKVLPFSKLNVSLGDKRYCYDESTSELWIPEQAYRPGSWGYIGGRVFTMENTSRHSYGSEKEIFGTELDPVFATQRVDIRQFKADVPNGDYEVTLDFAELNGDSPTETLAYNLGSDKAEAERFTERVFDVAINNIKVLPELSNKEDLQPQRAVSFRFKISVDHQEGITIDLNPIKAETILNAVQIEKIR